MNQAVPPIDSVLLVGFGGPTQPDQIMQYLTIVTCGRGIPPNRLESVAHHYHDVGGKSPYNELTEDLRKALQHWLDDQGQEIGVYAGMRNWVPRLPDTIAQMNRDGRKHAVAIILAAHRSESSWERYIKDVGGAIASNSGVAPKITFLDALYDRPRFFEANAQCIESASGYKRGEWPADVPVLFTAHSIPERMPGRDVYVSDLEVSCKGVAELLQLPDWELVYQSRSGPPSVPWLEPDVCDVLEARAAKGMKEVVVQAIGFLSDHVEVLFDLDMEAKEVCDKHDIRFHRAPCVNHHPEFVRLLGEEVLAKAGQPV